MSIRSKKSKKEKKMSIKYNIITTLVVIFFVGIILMYYSMLYSAKKDNIIKNGELTAKHSAEKIDRYLLINIDAIKLSAYTLDRMLEDNKSDKEIQDFLVSQSTAISSAVDENMTGLYGYINGRFFSGTNWIPPQDYVPTERPWYTKAMEKPGQITMLDPYVDIQSGNVMIALGKTLSDGESVLSVDVSLEQIQKQTEDALGTGTSDMEMVLNAKGVVVAHSKREEIGKDYSAKTDSLGGAIYSKLINTKAHYFEVEYEDSHYIAYVADMRDGWHCVSVKDATGVFESLNHILVITIFLALFVILIINIIMSRSNKRRIMAQNLSGQLSSTADIYVSLHEIDLLNDTFNVIRNNNDEVKEMIGNRRDNATQIIKDVLMKFSDAGSRDKIINFVNLETINERMKDHNTITSEFLSLDNKWRKARFIVSERNADGSILRVMFMIEDIDEEKKAREKASEAINILNSRVSSIANIYMTVHELDVATDTFTEIKSESAIVNDVVGETRVHAQATLKKVMETVSHELSYDDVMRFIDLSTLDKRLKDKDTVSVEYMNKAGLWRRARFIVSGRDENGNLIKILWLSEDIDNEKKERERLIDMSERAIAASEAKTAFLSNMSHELRTPINAILGMNEMILRESEDKKIVSYSEKIETTGNKLLGLVTDILDYSGIEAGKLEIVPKEYDLTMLIDEISDRMRPKVEEKGLSYILDSPDDLPAVLIGDRMRIMQIISNILANAIKYTEKGSVILGIESKKAEDDPDSVILDVYVKDTGTGIKPEDISKLFSKFERIEYAQGKGTEGIGLGMNITCKLLELMGSSLKVESVYGIGSKFYFSLKQKVAQTDKEA